MFLVIAVFCSFFAGAYLGWFLATLGVTADNALQRYQRQIHFIGFVALGIGTIVGVLMATGRNSPWVPSFLLLFVGAYLWNSVLLVCCFCAGLVLLLERPGWNDRQRLQQLLFFLVVNFGATFFLIYHSLSIVNLVETSQVLDGVVLQTTPYSCSAAAIATLANRVRPEQLTTELEVVKLAGTSRRGTSTQAEIQAMEKLRLAPQYERNQTIEDLVDRGQIAILHVMEPVAGTRISHAIALLEIDRANNTLTLANPLYGRQVKAFDEMTDYWIGEAVFVTTQQSPRSSRSRALKMVNKF